MTEESSTRRTVSTRHKPAQFADDGMPLCRWCGAKLKHKQLRYCPAVDGFRSCLHEWSIRSSVSYMRAEVEKRDNGICAACKCDTLKMGRILDGLEWGFGHRWDEDRSGMDRRAFEFYRDRVDAYGRQSLWDADHIVPVSEGGGLCGLDNIRTLCIPCHKDVTREMHKRKKERRKGTPPLLALTQDEASA